MFMGQKREELRGDLSVVIEIDQILAVLLAGPTCFDQQAAKIHTCQLPTKEKGLFDLQATIIPDAETLGYPLTYGPGQLQVISGRQGPGILQIESLPAAVRQVVGNQMLDPGGQAQGRFFQLDQIIAS